MHRAIVLLVPALLAPAAAVAQSVDGQVWLGGTFTVDVTKRTPLVLDTALRFGDSANGLYEWARGAMTGVRTKGGTEIIGGYQRVTGFTNGHVSRVEQRIRQQVSFALAKVERVTLTGRARVEERFRRNTPGMGLRARFQVRATRPLGSSEAPSLLASHESFVELNDTSWGSRAGLRRMRNLVGLDVPASKRLRMQLGYLNQYDFGAAGKRDQMAHIVSIAAVTRF